VGSAAGGEGEGTSFGGNDFEAALVFMHTWLRRTVAALIRSGLLLPLGATGGDVTLAPDEERVLLVRCLYVYSSIYLSIHLPIHMYLERDLKIHG